MNVEPAAQRVPLVTAPASPPALAPLLPIRWPAAAYLNLRLRHALAGPAPAERHRRATGWAAVALLALLAGGSAPSLLATLAVASVQPLDWAATQPMWIALPVVGLHALPGIALVRAAQHRLWLPGWTELEQAWPLGRGVLLGSDGLLVGALLLPLFGLYAAGALGAFPPASHRWLAMTLLAASMSLSLGTGLAFLQRRRRRSQGRAPVWTAATPALWAL